MNVPLPRGKSEQQKKGIYGSAIAQIYMDLCHWVRSVPFLKPICPSSIIASPISIAMLFPPTPIKKGQTSIAGPLKSTNGQEATLASVQALLQHVTSCTAIAPFMIAIRQTTLAECMFQQCSAPVGLILSTHNLWKCLLPLNCLLFAAKMIAQAISNRQYKNKYISRTTYFLLFKMHQTLLINSALILVW